MLRYTAASILLLLACTVASLAAPPPADFYVSPRGRDTWTGKLPAPNRRKSDGPFATVDRARAAVREAVTSGRKKITVLIRGGEYALVAPLTFTAEDSAPDGGSITYAAYPDEEPVLTGGRQIAGWHKDAHGRWVTTIPDVTAGKWYFSQLFVNGERRYRPRLPKNGYYEIAGEVVPSSRAPGRSDSFRFHPGEIRADWQNRGDVEVLGFLIWSMARLRIADVDSAKNVVSFTGATWGNNWMAGLLSGHRFIVENVREALSAPGEWYLDRHTGELTYIPMPGETMGRAKVVAPVIDQLVRFQGDPANRRWIRGITLRGITLAHTNWSCPPEGNVAPQAESNLGAAVMAVGTRDCSFEDCRISHVGTYAVELGRACQRNRIERCQITDMGAGGVKLGELESELDPELLASHNTVTDCLIAHGGRMHPAGIGVFIGASPYNSVSHNDIFDLYYTGISVGWSWGYNQTASHHNTLEANHIWHLGQGVLSDMGGTYTLGLAPGTIQRGNRIHDVRSFSYGGWGIYFDEGTTGMLAEKNLVYDTSSAGFHQHYGENNVVRNNVFAFGQEAQVMRTRPEDHLSFTFERNIVTWSEGPLLGGNLAGNRYRFDHNIYWPIGGRPFDFAGASLDQWRARGQDASSLIVDPLFVNVTTRDFHLKPGSPASRIGFEPLGEAFTAGRRLSTSSSASALKPAPAAFPGPPAPKPPQPIADDFESTAVGAKPAGATLSEENDVAVIRVTDETAATGKHSLKLVDAPGQKLNYNPHMYYKPGFSEGTIDEAFALRVERGTVMYHEWRDSAAPYHVGPSIHVTGDGAVRVGNREIARIPVSQWIRIRVTCALGAGVNGTWDLSIQMPGRTAPLMFRHLPCDRTFHSLDWLGFTADGTESATFYIDDLSIGPRRR